MSPARGHGAAAMADRAGCAHSRRAVLDRNKVTEKKRLRLPERLFQQAPRKCHFKALQLASYLQG